ncbi:NADP oxidoreductase [Saccharomonospora piscinae]|uniref:NADPH-dependent F420 reductase n=1 Tax=Saccharomonospora piscinae TaxID=687388 RepID=UPI0011067719|nr:NAD(P)-binding domain-containing protein [Saccharomonospora piscinae]TLW91118.1 NADP oxidoreductase [Saccharomonospora piscinae]
MRIGILGTGTLALALGRRWAEAGHDLVVGGRSAPKATAVAQRLGGRAGTFLAAATERDAVLLAVPWSAVEDVLSQAEAQQRTLAGTTVIDPANALDDTGALRTAPAASHAEHVATLAPGAHVVKAFHLWPARRWNEHEDAGDTVVICGDEPGLPVVSALVRDAGATPAVLGPLSRARQLEETAGFALGLALAGTEPRSALPAVGAR